MSGPGEAAEQAQFVSWFRAHYPKDVFALRTSMAGVPRHGRKGAVIWNFMKSQGINKGEPDIALLIPRGCYGSLVIEHKGDGMSRQLTGEQAQALAYHEEIGNMAVQTRGLDELISVVEDYLCLS